MERSGTWWTAAVAGVASAAAALGTAELLSGLIGRVPSIVVGVADVVVDEASGGVVRWSIDTFGSSQKALLVTGVTVGALVLGGVLGVVARRRFMPAAGGIAAFGAIGWWAADRQPGSSAFGSGLTAIVATAAGIAALAVLLDLQSATTPPAAGGARRGLDRRWFLAASGATATFALLGAGIGRRLRQSAAVEAARADLAGELGGAVPVVPTDLETFDAVVPGVSPLVTPTRDFYRIDTALFVPQVELDGWTLRITGLVDREVDLDVDDLLAMDRIDEYVTLACVSNEVGGDLVGNAYWSGVPLAAVLDLAGVDARATQIVGRSVDGWTAGFPTEVALDGRPAMVAIAMNGEPLPVVHGFPARLVVPGLYGYVSATKWLREIELTTWDAFDGYWIPRGWAKEGPIKTQSRIDVPRRGATIPVGRTAVAGVAWAPTREIERVEVRVDEGPWATARLSGALSDSAWVQWVYEWDASPGRHRLQVRATDGSGQAQTAEVTPPAPSGATGHHTVHVEVA